MLNKTIEATVQHLEHLERQKQEFLLCTKDTGAEPGCDRLKFEKHKSKDDMKLLTVHVQVTDSRDTFLTLNTDERYNLTLRSEVSALLNFLYLKFWDKKN